jgi:hypothetical protein
MCPPCDGLIVARPPVPSRGEPAVADVAFVVLTVVFFAVVAVIARRAADR